MVQTIMKSLKEHLCARFQKERHSNDRDVKIKKAGYAD